MKQKQLDIFGGARREDGNSPFAEAAAPAAKPRRARRRREAKKAPMLVDACRFEEQPSDTRRETRDTRHPTPDARRETRTSQTEPIDPRMVARDSELGAEDAQEAVREEGGAAGPKIYTVSEITARIKAHLEEGFTDVWLAGEITDFRNRTGRHLYFALKDKASKIRAIIFGAEGQNFPFELADGLEVLVHGRLNVYAPQGSYSLIIDRIEPRGLGALQLAFEQLKKKLEGEGLFDRARKRPLPSLPRRIGVVTSPTGAAVRDIVHVLTRRFPGIEILLHPVRVQGEGAAGEIAAAIETMNGTHGLDLLIVGRGGGSVEDLWAFNEEAVARAIAASRLPVISAVGHEIDFTIADFVADVRAATPSAAAEIAVPEKARLAAEIADDRRRLALALRQLFALRGHELKRLAQRLADPGRRLPDLLQRADAIRDRLLFAMGTLQGRLRQGLAKLASELEHLSPLGVLAKGYAVAQGASGQAIRSASSLKVGEELQLRFHRGSARARVTKIVDG